MKVEWEERAGAAIDREQRDEWARDCIKQLQKNPDLKTTYVASGDRIVIATRFGNDSVWLRDALITRSGIQKL